MKQLSVLNKEIAERLVEIRELYELTAEELASRIEMNHAEYEKYESGELEIPISLLYNVCHALDVSMTEILTGEQAKLHIYSLVKNGKGVIAERSGEYAYRDLAYNFAGRDIQPMLVEVPVMDEKTPYPLNVHTGQEFHYCVEGSYRMLIDKYEFVVEKGDSVYFNSSYSHGMKGIGDSPAQILVIVI